MNKNNFINYIFRIRSKINLIEFKKMLRVNYSVFDSLSLVIDDYNFGSTVMWFTCVSKEQICSQLISSTDTGKTIVIDAHWVY